jgi:ankyrin repeat protein
VELLLQNGASVNTESKYTTKRGDYDSHFDFLPALPYAVFYPETVPAIIQILLSYGADISYCTEDGFTVLHMVNNAKVAEILLAAGAKALSNRRSRESKTTPLMCACEKGYIDVVKILLIHGAKVNVKDAEGCNALDYALEVSK